MNLQELKQNALDRHIPIIMDETLEVIEKILKSQDVNRLLEIGTAVGYSAACFAKNINGVIDTIELNQERAVEAISNITALGLENKVNIINGDALDVLPTITYKYDIIFIDASKSKYPKFLDYSLELLNDNGIIIADNVLYKGYVLSDYNKHKQRTAVRHLREFIKKCKENPNIDLNLLEVGDGLAVIRKVTPRDV